MYPPLGILQTWEGIPPPGQPSDHVGAEEGHQTFLGGDAWDMGLVYNSAYAIASLDPIDIYEYTAKSGQYRGWNFEARLADGRLVVYAHLQNAPEGRHYKEGEQIEIIGDYLDSDHLHFELEGVLAGDMPALFSIPIPILKKEVDEDMLEVATPDEDGFYLAGWFTKGDPWKCDILVIAKTALTDVEVYWGDKRQGVYNMGRFNAKQDKVVPGKNIPGSGTVWLKPVGGDILRATIRTYK